MTDVFVSRNLYLTQDHEYILMLFLRNCIILAFMFRYTICVNFFVQQEIAC